MPSIKIAEIAEYFGDNQCLDILEEMVLTKYSNYIPASSTKQSNQLNSEVYSGSTDDNEEFFPDNNSIGTSEKEGLVFDFNHVKIIDGSSLFIFALAKKYSAKCINLPKHNADMYERFSEYKFYNPTIKSLMRTLNLHLRDLVIITDDLFLNKEHSRLAIVKGISKKHIMVDEFYRAHFNIDSKELKTHTVTYTKLALAYSKPYIHKPVKQEMDFILNILYAHKFYDFNQDTDAY